MDSENNGFVDQAMYLNRNSTVYSSSAENKSLDKKKSLGIDAVLMIIFFVVLLLVLIGLIIWWLICRRALNVCLTSDSFSCPVYYCGTIEQTGDPGTICPSKSNATKATSAFRYDEEGNLQCQT